MTARWRSLYMQLPEHGQVVDLHAFDPAHGWEEYYYGLPTIRDFPSFVSAEIAWQTFNGWLILDKRITVWRPSDSADPQLMYYFKEAHTSTERGKKWGVSFAP